MTDAQPFGQRLQQPLAERGLLPAAPDKLIVTARQSLLARHPEL